MSGLPPVDLASAFGSPRSAGLTGLLPAKEPTPAQTAPRTGPSPEPVATPSPTPRGGRKNTSTQPAPTAAVRPKVGRPRAVIVYVTPQQQRWLREHVAPGRTLTDVALDALEAHQARLTPPAPPSERQGLFARTARPAPQPGVQIQLRMTPGNLEVLDQLVDDRGFPSRSALIRAALAAEEGS